MVFIYLSNPCQNIFNITRVYFLYICSFITSHFIPVLRINRVKVIINKSSFQRKYLFRSSLNPKTLPAIMNVLWSLYETIAKPTTPFFFSNFQKPCILGQYRPNLKVILKIFLHKQVQAKNLELLP